MNGSCELCGAPASYRCRMCGRLVCSKHYDENTGLCSACSAALCEICGERLSTTYCPICGRLICTRCSIQITPVHRICVECYRRIGDTREALKAMKRPEAPKTPRIREAAARIHKRFIPN